MAAADGELYKDTFLVVGLDLQDAETEDAAAKRVAEKKFDKVSRVSGSSENYSTTLMLDVNTEIYPVDENDRIEVLLADDLDGRGVLDASDRGYDPSRKLDGRAKDYEYIMYGKIFKYAESNGKTIVYASFGGLLMALKGEPRTLNARAFSVDTPVYLFLRKMTDSIV